MSSLIIRPFTRADRDQVTALVNGHCRAVVPGVSVSVNAVLSQLEGEPREPIVGPWVTRRATLVAELKQRVVGATLLTLYGDSTPVGEAFQGLGEVRWLVFSPLAPDEPPNPHWPDPSPAGPALLDAAIAMLRAWGATRIGFEGGLPAPGAYGVPEQLSHVRLALTDSGFTHTGDAELVHLQALEHARTGHDLHVARTVGINGTRLTGHIDEEVVGYVEVELLDAPHWGTARPLLADIGNLEVAPQHRRKGHGAALLAAAADWAMRSGAQSLLAYSQNDNVPVNGLLRHSGYTQVTRIERGWSLTT